MAQREHSNRTDIVLFREANVNDDGSIAQTMLYGTKS
jgi:hypothetical protein